MKKFNEGYFNGLEKLYESNSNLQECAQTYGCSVSTIRNKLQRAGRDTSNKKHELVGLKEMYENGHGLQRCADHYGCSASTIYHRLIALKVPIRRRVYTDICLEELKNLYVSGKTIKQCAEHFQCNTDSIRRRLVKIEAEIGPVGSKRLKGLVDMYNETKSMQVCADYYGRSIFHIHKLLIKEGALTLD